MVCVTLHYNTYNNDSDVRPLTFNLLEAPLKINVMIIISTYSQLRGWLQ